ncbi:MAG: hypothetical protein Kow00114_40710 [Kiloniellaceae bacterium]
MPLSYPARPVLGLAAALLVAACAGGGTAPQATADDPALAAFLREQVEAYQSQLETLPQDAGLAVTVAAYDTVIDLTFKYLRDDPGKAAFVAQFTNAVLVKHSCADPKATYWMGKGVVFRFSFRDRENGLLLRSDVNDRTCAELRSRGETLPS